MQNDPISPENAILLLENAFVRERFDWQMWDLRQMKHSVELMKKIATRTDWRTMEKESAKLLGKSIDDLLDIIDQKDATRVIAGHTHVERAMSDLRSAIFRL